MRRLAYALLLVAGCHSSSSSQSSELTYWKSVKPIADAKCVGCHTENNIAPFTLGSFADFKSHSDKVRVAVANHVMPPWPPGSGCSDYLDDRSLTDAEIATITGWIDHGAVEGKPSDYQPGTPASTGLTRVDRTLQLEAPYTPTLTPDEYRCFLMDWPETHHQVRERLPRQSGQRRHRASRHRLSRRSRPTSPPISSSTTPIRRRAGSASAARADRTAAPRRSGSAPGHPARAATTSPPAPASRSRWAARWCCRSTTT